MLFSRSFRIIQFLNRRHGGPVKVVFALLGFAAVLLSTGQLVLARASAHEFWSSSFKPAGRRVGWYLRTGWMQWHIAHDPFFNFTENVEARVVKAQERFLKGAKRRLSDPAWYGDMMLIDAYWAHDALVHADRQNFDRHFHDFSHRAGVFLNVDVQNAPSPRTRPTEKTVYADFPRLAGQTLADFKAIMSKTNWDWFVTGGTLLGAIRHNDFLAHDNDLDVGTFMSPTDAHKLAQIFEDDPTFTTAKMDIKMEIQSGSNGELRLHQEPALLKLVHANGVNLDIFFHYSVEGQYVHGSGTMAWANTSFELSDYVLAGMDVLGPADADLYLTEHYGNWREERKDFSCVTDTTNITYVQNLFTTAFHIRRLNFLRMTDPERAREIEKSLLNQGIIVEVDNRFALSSDLFPHNGTAMNLQSSEGDQHDNDDAFERWGRKAHRRESPQAVH